MKKKEKDNLIDIYGLNYKILYESTLLTLSFYENQYKLYDDLITSYSQSKPLKIFKNSYKKWEKRLEILNQKYEIALDNYINNCKILENIIIPIITY